jgi:hypothetical protein
MEGLSCADGSAELEQWNRWPPGEEQIVRLVTPIRPVPVEISRGGAGARRDRQAATSRRERQTSRVEWALEQERSAQGPATQRPHGSSGNTDPIEHRRAFPSVQSSGSRQTSSRLTRHVVVALHTAVLVTSFQQHARPSQSSTPSQMAALPAQDAPAAMHLTEPALSAQHD